MKSGEIAGLLHTVGKPVDLFSKFKNEAGFRFLPIPFDKFDDFYVPSTLTAEDYPGFMKAGEKVDTIGVPAVLAVYNWPRDSDRFRRIARFIDVYFEKFGGFRQAPYHPKWRDINLASTVPGCDIDGGHTSSPRCSPRCRAGAPVSGVPGLEEIAGEVSRQTPKHVGGRWDIF
jgi:hypothetical protein